ncbi:hypothetical protein BJY52DRAFT_358591 [Lactarius psammicola]|nr:hypothetical protein BJY52DRAFT_358591 [Lactarius psammicola]
MRALFALMLLAFNVEPPAAALGTLTRLTLPYAIYDELFACTRSRARLTPFSPRHYLARRRAEGARAHLRSRCGHTHARAVVGCAGKYGGSRCSRWLSRALQMRSRCKRCTSRSACYCRTCRRFARPACGLLWRLTEVAKAEDGLSRLTQWTRPPLGSALCCGMFPSGAHWELERGEWVRMD